MIESLTPLHRDKQATGAHLAEPIRRLAIAVAYGGLMVLIYSKLSVFWAYLGFSYQPLSSIAVALTIVIAAFPATLLPSQPKTLAPFAAWLLYFTLFMPAMIIPQIQGWLAPERGVPLFATLWGCTIVFILLARSARRPMDLPRTSTRIFWPTIIVAVLVLNLAIILVFGSSLRLVGFEDVYEQRFASQFGLSNIAIIYVLSNLSSAVNPFLIATGIAEKSYFRIALGIFGQLLVYSAIAGKIVIFSIVVVAATFLIFDKHRQLRPNRLALGMLLIAILGVPLMAIYRPGGSQLMNFVDLLYLRTLYMPGVTTGAYFDFFSQYPVTYFSHSLVGQLILDYPYNNMAVGQVVGSYIVPGSTINYNANFIASDGITALGMVGIPIVVIAALIVLRTIGKTLGGVDQRVVCASFMPFLMLLADGSLLTAMVTGGGCVLTFLLWLWGGTVKDVVSEGNEPRAYEVDSVAPMTGAVALRDGLLARGPVFKRERFDWK